MSASYRLRGNRNSACSGERYRQTAEHHKVGVKADALNAAHAEHRKAEGVLEPSKFSLHG